MGRFHLAAKGTEMFSAHELVSNLYCFSNVKSGSAEIVEFGQYDFNDPSSEQSILASRWSKQELESAFHNWITNLQTHDWTSDSKEPLASNSDEGRCHPITKPEFVKLVSDKSWSLNTPLPQFLLGCDEYWWGLKLDADWNEVGAIAELMDSYIAFLWSTSA